MESDPQTHPSQHPFDRAEPPDLGVLKASASQQWTAFGMALMFSVVLFIALLERDQTSSTDLITMLVLIPPLIIVFINAALLKIYVEKGAIIRIGLFKISHVLYKDILSVGKRKIKVKHTERDAIMFFTVQNKQVLVLRGSITEHDYDRLYQWAIQHFPET